METTATPAITFRRFEPGDEIAFRELNEVWIVRHFTLEEPDRKVLGDPANYILKPGGEILMVDEDREEAVLDEHAKAPRRSGDPSGSRQLELRRWQLPRWRDGAGVGDCVGFA